MRQRCGCTRASRCFTARSTGCCVRNCAYLMAGFFPYLRVLLEAFARLAESHPQPCMVNRGVARDLVGTNPNLYKLTWWGLSSTTKDFSALQVR